MKFILVVTTLAYTFLVFSLGRFIPPMRLTEAYNRGYRAGMLHAYDNVVICGASPEDHGMAVASAMQSMNEPVLSINCSQ